MPSRKHLAAKRIVDVVGATVGLVAFAPLMAVAAAAIAVDMGRPVLFKQQRPGLHGEPFTILKFRTMRSGAASDASRLTKLGHFFRETSIDELPQLWNVLRGEMSLVGPRPLLMEYLPLYSARHAHRHDTKPGITTWNAVNGRNSLTWEEQFEMDVWYVENESLALDFKIMLLTVGKVLVREGVHQEGRATRDRFVGLDEVST